MRSKKNKKKSKFKKIFILPIVIIVLVIISCIYCYMCTTPVSKKSDKVTFEITSGSTIKDIATTLKDEELVRNYYFFLAYVKLNKISGMQAGDYSLDKNMSLKEITDILKKGSNVTNKEITITFKEGKTIEALSDNDYIKTLINKYWFLDDVILDSNIYYPLEGYLAPDTYNFKVNASVEDIFEKMLDQTDKILTEYKSGIESSNFKVHQILTLASMVESEGVSLEDRKNIAGVFINRLNKNMALGSDVTTYYASKIELGERDLYVSEINSDNPYNTRSAKNAGKLPVGPICNPSKGAIEAVISYTPNDYLYFVADKNMKVYFTKTDAEHNKKIQELKKQGLWFEY